MKWRTCAILFCTTAVLADDEWREVKTAQGPVRGRKHPKADLYAFYNIPYATAPVGVDKFKAPLPPPVWLEPLDAIDKEVICPQPDFQYIDFMPKTTVQLENCLIANVFVPITDKKNLSVLVYVHGGAFILGYGNMMKKTQYMMKTKDFILVNFNYRLGVHGFLCLGTNDIPGNAGMKDQVALLRWVKKNIASFGGNPDDVTLAGGSAGSASVDLVMLSKSAEGLFQRVVPESGGNLAAFAIQRDPVEIAKKYAKELNFTNVDDIYALEEFYKTAPLKLLTSDSFFDRTDSTFMFSPCVERDTGDEAFLTESPLSILKKGNYKKLPMLYGFANMEGLMRVMFYDFWKPKMNEKFSDFLPADLKFESDEEREVVADKIKKYYFGDKPIGDDNILGYVDFFSDVIFTYPMLRATKLQVEAGNNQIYLYEYSFVEDEDPVVPHTNVRGATHCAQSMALVDIKNMTHPDDIYVTPKYRKMKNVVREIWHNFLKTGKPVPEGSSLPAWPAASANRSPHMVLDEKMELRGVLLEERTRFWDDIYQKYYRDAVPPPKPPPKGRIEL
uniref:Carboxylic ester hydrolase n=1 Tax=Sesamia inferens TaxID=492764 RepID=A0A076FRL8_SESIF|nr:odorant degrading enzyme CXE14 [Sesamia inferens]